MPGLVEKAASSAKRKRTGDQKKPAKRARSESSDDDVQARILLLENEIFESRKHLNNITTLINLVRSKDGDSEDALVSAIALCRVFSRLMASGDLTKKKSAAENETKVVEWLKQRYADYKTAMLALFRAPEFASTVLTLCMRTLKAEGTYLGDGEDFRFPTRFLQDIIRTLLTMETGEDVRTEYSSKFVEEYDDVRFYTFEVVGKILDENHLQSPWILDNVLTIFAAIESVPEDKAELEDFYVPAPKKKTHSLYSLTVHKKHAQAAWLALMKMEMDKEQRKAILGLMSTSIAPWFNKPELLMDFLTDSYDAGGSTSLQALSGVFYLIQERNLDYPLFYRKLYSLLDNGILHSKHRSRFFRLLDTFMSSTHLPAVMVASFVKRLSRLTLNAPPAGVIAVVPWIYNILKKHPTCTFMIHREVRGQEAKDRLAKEGMNDPFLPDEEDPMETKAIESSLWEIVTLQSHYHPNVATLAKIISEQFTKQSYNLEDFLDHSYGSMLDAELSKEVKKVPVIEYEIPKKILTKHEAGSAVEDSLLVKLWDFS